MPKAKKAQDMKSVPQPERKKCGFCPATFETTADLYAHQRREHDPDGLMFSELGLPK